MNQDLDNVPTLQLVDSKSLFDLYALPSSSLSASHSLQFISLRNWVSAKVSQFEFW